MSTLLLSRLSGIAVFTLVIFAMAIDRDHHTAATGLSDHPEHGAGIEFGHGETHGLRHDHMHSVEHAGVEHDRYHVTAHDPQAECTCAENRLQAGWCATCDMGYVAGMIIESARLFAVLDAHGHQIIPSSIKCTSCQAALKTDGFCTVCQWGFVDDALYVTELSWSLGRGHVINPAGLDCGHCRDATLGQGWCSDCHSGQVGAVRFDDWSCFIRAAAQQALLEDAVVTLARCEECALRTFTGGVCRECGTSWE